MTTLGFCTGNYLSRYSPEAMDPLGRSSGPIIMKPNPSPRRTYYLGTETLKSPSGPTIWVLGGLGQNPALVGSIMILCRVYVCPEQTTKTGFWAYYGIGPT